MEYFLSVDGGRSGPFTQFQIIDRIREGSLTGAELVWHRGLDGWKPVRELDEFHGYWKPTVEQIEKAEELRRSVREEIDRPRPWLRFWARLLDYLWFSTGMWLLMTWTVPDEWLRWTMKMFVLGAPLYGVFFLIFAPLEAWWLSRHGTTPSKSLLRIEVRRLDGNLPTFQQAIMRSLLVYVRGVALWIMPLPLTLFTMSWARLRLLQQGITTWDRDTGLRTEHGETDSGRYFSVFVLLVLNSMATSYIFRSSPGIMAGIEDAFRSLHL